MKNLMNKKNTHAKNTFSVTQKIVYYHCIILYVQRIAQALVFIDMITI